MVPMDQSVWDRFLLYYFKARHVRLPSTCWTVDFLFFWIKVWTQRVSFILSITFPPLFTTWLFALVLCFSISGSSLWTDLTWFLCHLLVERTTYQHFNFIFSFSHFCRLRGWCGGQHLCMSCFHCNYSSFQASSFCKQLSPSCMFDCPSQKPRDSNHSLLIILTYTSYLSRLEYIFQSINYFGVILYPHVRPHLSLRHGILYHVKKDSHPSIFLKDTPLSDNVVPCSTTSWRECVLIIAQGGIVPHAMWKTHLRLAILPQPEVEVPIYAKAE